MAGGGGFAGTPDPGVCGNGVHEWSEECDDGDTSGGDGCSAACTIEAGYACDLTGCHVVVCGDGRQDWYPVGGGLYDFEECDDGNAIGEDGCSSSCDIEIGFVCGVPGEPCREVRCGDGLQDGYFVPGDPGSSGAGGSAGTAGTSLGGAAGAAGGYIVYEACDDGNEVSGDGCTAACEIEPGYLCHVPGTPCREPRCGDGFQDYISTPGSGGSSGGFGGSAGMAGDGGFFENCDDGNVVSGDGCTSDCNVEEGYLCAIPGTPCRIPTCGDGFIDYIPDPNGCLGSSGAGGSAGSGTGGSGGFAGASPCGMLEECDDGNVASSDGCSQTCSPEPGYVCMEPGMPCTVPECGNGIVEWPVEECDDGNTDPSDGCSECRVVW